MRYIETNFYVDRKQETKLLKIMITMLLGSIFGSLFFVVMSEKSLEEISAIVNAFIQSPYNNLSFVDYIEIVLKNIKLLAFIWFLAFIPIGYVFVYMIIFYKGFVVGFVGGIFLSTIGISYAISKYMIENIYTISLILFLASCSLKYQKNKVNNIDFSLKKYIKMLLISVSLNLIFIIIIYK